VSQTAIETVRDLRAVCGCGVRCVLIADHARIARRDARTCAPRTSGSRQHEGADGEPQSAPQLPRLRGVLPPAELPSARRGWELFTGDARCSRCHFGPNLTDRAFHSLGIGWDATSKRYTDEGRGAITGRPADRGAFKTPTLRDVARHPPYMHDGSLPTLRDVVLFYKRGGVKNPHLDTQIRPLRLSSTDVDALVAFLEALNGEGFIDRVPSAFPK
jgi:hypothetical protein